MKKLLSILSITLLTMSAFAQLSAVPEKEIPADYGYIVKIGEQMPDITMELTDGTKVSTADLKGKVTMLQFTASWCSVCRKEMPHIEKEIWQKHKDNEDFVLIGVDMDEPLDKVKDFKETMEITYPLALDPGADIFYTFAAKGAGVTRNVIVDKTGKIVYMTRLFKEDEFNEMVEVIGLLLKE
ncbi:TlpA disulfide reductase family protein [uncultured Draconibacterium sp.]|uniref:TlpA family protein disulfide reductase n=1 Tax=uncultured Draconibacterium sp. TaxID=1573823 RepID=UPI002AA805A0|nr:TlpA disulfide reductase family protein [uncultured Draconibacterium sp.]